MSAGAFPAAILPILYGLNLFTIFTKTIKHMGRLSKEAADDKRIIEENPGATPKQLLAKGLSQAGYEALMAEQPQTEEKPQVKSEPQKQAISTANDDHGPVMPTVQKQAAAVPKLQAAEPLHDGGMVTVVTPEGNRIAMTRTAANRMFNPGRNPQYKIEG